MFRLQRSVNHGEEIFVGFYFLSAGNDHRDGAAVDHFAEALG